MAGSGVARWVQVVSGAVRTMGVAGLVHWVYSLISESDGIAVEHELKSAVGGDQKVDWSA